VAGLDATTATRFEGLKTRLDRRVGALAQKVEGVDQKISEILRKLNEASWERVRICPFHFRESGSGGFVSGCLCPGRYTRLRETSSKKNSKFPFPRALGPYQLVTLLEAVVPDPESFFFVHSRLLGTFSFYASSLTGGGKKLAVTVASACPSLAGFI